MTQKWETNVKAKGDTAIGKSGAKKEPRPRVISKEWGVSESGQKTAGYGTN